MINEESSFIRYERVRSGIMKKRNRYENLDMIKVPGLYIRSPGLYMALRLLLAREHGEAHDEADNHGRNTNPRKRVDLP